MFLKEKESAHLVEILDLDTLIDPTKNELIGRYNRGEEMPDADHFNKGQLVFPSGEALPRCWLDVHYRDQALKR